MKWVLALAATGLACFLVFSHQQHWLADVTGTINEPGPFYGFWSGFGSDIGEITLIVGAVAFVRHHNCHVAGCLRLGRPVEGTPYVACPTHHPAHQGTKRNVDLSTIHRAHREHT